MDVHHDSTAWQYPCRKAVNKEVKEIYVLSLICNWVMIMWARMCNNWKPACTARFYIGILEIRKENEWNVCWSYDTFNCGGLSFSLSEQTNCLKIWRIKQQAYKNERLKHSVNLHYFGSEEYINGIEVFRGSLVSSNVVDTWGGWGVCPWMFNSGNN